MKKFKFFLNNGKPFCLEPGKPLEAELNDNMATAVTNCVRMIFKDEIEQQEKDGVVTLTFKDSEVSTSSFDRLFSLLGVELPNKVEPASDAYIPASKLDSEFVDLFNLDSSASYPTYVLNFQRWWRSTTDMLATQGCPRPENYAATVVKGLPQYSSPNGSKVTIKDLKIVIEKENE